MMPFAGGIEGTANATLLFSVVAAVLYGFMVNAEPSLRRSAVGTLAVALLAVLVMVEHGPMLLAGALALSAAGIAWLSRYPDMPFLPALSPQRPWLRPVLWAACYAVQLAITLGFLLAD